MHRGLRDLPGGGPRESRDGAVLPMPRGAHRLRRRLEHGQDNDSGKRGHLRDYRRGRAYIRRSLATPLTDHT